MTLRSTLLLASTMLAVAGQAVAATGTFPSKSTTVTTNAIFGGGASLPAPYLRQASDCWGDKIDLAFRGVAATTTIFDFNYAGVPAFNCATTQVSPVGQAVSYISTGSGRGILGYFAHSPFYVDPIGKTGDSWLGSGTGPAPTVYATKVNFGASEAGLPQHDANDGGDIDTYNGTSVDGLSNPVSRYVIQSGVAIEIPNTATSPAPFTASPGVTLPGTVNTTPFAQPLATYGHAIQIPLLVAIPTVSFSSVYKKVASSTGKVTSYKFLQATATQKLRLSNKQLCAIFSGTVSDWNQLTGIDSTNPISKATADTAAFSVPLQIVGRSDGSGTTSIFYRHLEKICGAGNAYTVDANTAGGNAPTTLPSALQGPTYDKTQPNVAVGGEVTTKFTRADGNDGVAKYLSFTAVPTANNTLVQGRIGYVGNDYVLPYVLKNGQNTYGLFSAALQNSKNAYVAATPAAALLAFAAVQAPQTTSGAAPYYYTPGLNGDRSNPATNATTYAWVSAANIASPLADPTATGSYPLVGTTNGLFYQCYADTTETTIVQNFLSWYYSNGVVNDKSKGILAINGFAPVTPQYQSAIQQTFLLNNYPLKTGGTATPLNLDIQQAGSTFTAECPTGVTGA